MWHRALFLVSLVGCTARPGEPSLREVEPSALEADRGGTLSLHGDGLFPAGPLDFDRPQSSSLSTAVSAELELDGVRAALTEVTWVDSTRVEGRVVPGLTPGLWAVHLVTPRGEVLTLRDALRLEAAAPDAGPQPCDTLTWLDQDQDGYGLPDSGALLCGGGRVLDATDCNDIDALSSPAGVELCNQLDDDCDGALDEGCGDGGFSRVRGGGSTDFLSASAWAPERLWIVANNRLVVLEGDAGLIESSANCPMNMNAVWAMPSGRAFVGGGNNGVGRLATATKAVGCQQSQLIPEPVVGMVGFPSSDGGVRVEAVLRDGRRASWGGVGPVEVFGEPLPTGFVLFDAHGSAPDALYAVGGTTGSPRRPAVFRLQADGGFAAEPLPPQGVQDGQLHGVWVLSPDEVVAVGDKGLVLRRVGGVWERIAPPSNADYTTVRAFSIGRFSLSTEFGYLRQWSGRWSLRYTDEVPVRDLTAFDEEHFWLVGDDGVIIRGP